MLKDNIMLAGVPMMNGAATLEGYVPNIDATVVTRILDAGGTIVGKAHCESFCLSGGSHTSASGPVHNPRKMGYSAGGSSSGSAALVAAGEVDMALGGDQGGSIRIPASFCGIYGMKPTHGLVPYTGIMPIEIFVDHTGPMTANVADNALLLEVLAGPDGYDPRQYNVRVQPYCEAFGRGVSGLRIGVVRKASSRPTPRKMSTRRSARRRSVLPGWCDGGRGVDPDASCGTSHLDADRCRGADPTIMYGDGYGVSRPDLYVTSLMDHHRNWQTRANELSETTKAFTLLGSYIRRQHGSRYYGKAMNIARRLTAAYDAALAQRPVAHAHDADQGDAAPGSGCVT